MSPGFWAKEVAKLAGSDLPLVPNHHQYLVTKTIPEVRLKGMREIIAEYQFITSVHLHTATIYIVSSVLRSSKVFS